MEKKLYKLKVDEEFAKLIPPLAEDERQRLEESIQKEGCTDPLFVWDGTIIDGHNRYSICTKLGIPFSIEEKNEFSDRDAVKMWIIERQLARRNLTKYQKGELALAFEPLLREEAKRRQGARNDLDPNFEKNSSQSDEENRTRNKVANIAGVSHDTIRKIKKIDAVADEEMKKSLINGDISVHKAFSELFGRKTPDTVKMVGKEKAIHVEGRMPDEPESFPVVKGLLEEVASNYIVSLEHILLQYTSGMVTEENDKEILSLFKKANRDALKVINTRLQEVAK